MSGTERAPLPDAHSTSRSAPASPLATPQGQCSWCCSKPASTWTQHPSQAEPWPVCDDHAGIELRCGSRVRSPIIPGESEPVGRDESMWWMVVWPLAALVLVALLTLALMALGVNQ